MVFPNPLALSIATALISMPQATLSHLTSSEAYAEASKVIKIKAFVYDWLDKEQTDALHKCQGRSTVFADHCPVEGADNYADECTNWSCSGDAICYDQTSSATCGPSTSDTCVWNDMGNKKDSLCCSDGEVKCENDADGEEYNAEGVFGWKCCDECNGDILSTNCDMSASQYYDLQAKGAVPKMDGRIALCSSVGGSCRTCSGIGQYENTPGGESDGKQPKERCEQDYGKCILDEDGSEVTGVAHPLQTNCIGKCVNANGDQQCTWCTAEATCQSNAGTCTGSSIAGGWNSDQGICTSNYYCDGYPDETSAAGCSSQGGIWGANVWTPGIWKTASFEGGDWEEVTAYPDKSSCEAVGTGSFCYTCDGDTTRDSSVSPSTCSNNGICTGPADKCSGDQQHNCPLADGCTWNPLNVIEAKGTFTSEDSCRDAGAKCQKCSDSISNDPNSCLNSRTCFSPGGAIATTGCTSSQSCCEDCGECGSCDSPSVMGVTSEIDCGNKGYTWTKNTFSITNTIVDVPEYTNEDTCNGGGMWWKRQNFWHSKNVWDVGTLHGGPPMAGYAANGTCAYGSKDEGVCRECGEHFPTGDFLISGVDGLVTEHIMMNGYVKDIQFISDATGATGDGTAATALAANPDYYDKLQPWLTAMGNVRVSHSSLVGATKQKIILGHSGATLLFRPENSGGISTVACGTGSNPACPVGLTPSDLHSIVIEPINYDVGDNEILFSVGDVTVTGGQNFGKIEITTSGKVRISEIENSGEVDFANSEDVFIAGLPNSGKITFTNTKTTFVDILNEATGDVTIDGGEYSAYGVVNKGTITVKAGSDISGHIKCNEGGTIIVEEGVTGSATVSSGSCQGTVSGDGASLFVYEDAPEYTNCQELKFTGENVTASTLNTEASKLSVRKKLASLFSVTVASVEIISITDVPGRRLRERSLGAKHVSTVKIDYSVIVSDETTKTTIQEKMGEMAGEDEHSTALSNIAETIAVQVGIKPLSITTAAEPGSAGPVTSAPISAPNTPSPIPATYAPVKTHHPAPAPATSSPVATPTSGSTTAPTSAPTNNVVELHDHKFTFPESCYEDDWKLICAIPSAFLAFAVLFLLLSCCFGCIFGCSSGRMNKKGTKSARMLSGLGGLGRDTSSSSIFAGENPMNVGKPERQVKAAPPTRPLQKKETWVKQFDHSSGHNYYENNVTGETQWDPPPGFDDGNNTL